MDGWSSADTCAFIEQACVFIRKLLLKKLEAFTLKSFAGNIRIHKFICYVAWLEQSKLVFYCNLKSSWGGLLLIMILMKYWLLLASICIRVMILIAISFNQARKHSTNSNRALASFSPIIYKVFASCTKSTWNILLPNPVEEIENFEQISIEQTTSGYEQTCLFVVQSVHLRNSEQRVTRTHDAYLNCIAPPTSIFYVCRYIRTVPS